MMKENGSNDFTGFSGRGRGRGLGRGRRWVGDYSLMDIRLVEPALLIFLNQDGLHGYGLLEKLAGIGLTEINPSMIYRILRDYEDLGLVQSEWDTDTTQGPPKRVYTITPEGRMALERAATSLRDTAQRIETMLDLFDLSKPQE
ncbi:MAG TPA: helix-turn-helix transcriptional regulator [Brevefilum sp.]|mgnify:FL=1|nr:helix-turn-helix transcriptional regulator [Brevefilum sp.]HOR18365.1 helix-turn-helix transcriptional regulator [Brevefilum sp.]